MKQERTASAPVAKSGRKFLPRVLIFLSVIVTWYGLTYFFPLDIWLLQMLAWVKGLGPWGPLIFAFLYIPSCVLMFPDILPNAAAGAIWGVGVGSVAVSFGRVLGSIATFLLTRGIAGGWIERKTVEDPKFAALAKAVERDGFRIVLLLRLCPLFPVIMLNYSLGLTSVSLGAYAMGTLVGMIPRTLFVAYVGSGTRSLFDLAAGGGAGISIHPAVYWGGLVFSLLIVVILAYHARRLVNEATQ